MNPYRIEPPAVISFSGGRSSGFMLWQILEAHDGMLPDGISVVFCNTGLEHQQTYEFIHRIGQNWISVEWIEYVLDSKGVPTFKVVDYSSASTRGEPFSLCIKKNKFLPNPRVRLCTANLKIRTLARYLKSKGWTEWDNVIGLRADEPRRVHRIKPHNIHETILCPMYQGGATKREVKKFWDGHPLDLGLSVNSNFGNCVGCFLKSYGLLEHIAREEPDQLKWWIETEEKTGATFRNDRPKYSKIIEYAEKQQVFDFKDNIDCYCTD